MNRVPRRRAIMPDMTAWTLFITPFTLMSIISSHSSGFCRPTSPSRAMAALQIFDLSLARQRLAGVAHVVPICRPQQGVIVFREYDRPVCARCWPSPRRCRGRNGLDRSPSSRFPAVRRAAPWNFRPNCALPCWRAACRRGAPLSTPAVVSNLEIARSAIAEPTMIDHVRLNRSAN